MKGLTKETYEYMQLKNRIISRIRVTVEHVFARMKNLKYYLRSGEEIMIF